LLKIVEFEIYKTFVTTALHHAAALVGNTTDIQWTHAKMQTMASLEPIRLLLLPAIQEAVLANFKAGTIVKQANSQQLVLAYGGKQMTSIVGVFFLNAKLACSTV